MQSPQLDHLLEHIRRLNEIGTALSAEKDLTRLLELILNSAMALTSADGGTLYTLTPERELRFQIVRNRSLGLELGGSKGALLGLESIPLFNEDGSPNEKTVVAYSVLNDRPVNIEDAYCTADFDFSGTRVFDERLGYRSKSFLVLPLKNHENDIIGAMQLINAIDPVGGEVTAFDSQSQRFGESIASQAAVAITNRLLIDSLEKLFESFITVLAKAIDHKSPYTGEHCRRVPALTLMLADAINNTDEGPLADFFVSDKARYELHIASLLHDCGKVTTPVHVMDKSTKLETIFDRIQLVDTRVEVLKRDLEIERLRALLEANGCQDLGVAESGFADRVLQLEEDRRFLRRCNLGGELMPEDDQDRVREIAKRRWVGPSGGEEPLLSAEEVENLTVPKGTLTAAERDTINHHIVTTIEMLEGLPFPKHMKNVPEYAGGHHERVDGKGYPRGLTRDQMSVPARAMAIADIFEALSSRDRPYKPPKALSECLAIMRRMAETGHIDADLYNVFLQQKVYLRYAEEFLEQEQIDEIDPLLLSPLAVAGSRHDQDRLPAQPNG